MNREPGVPKKDTVKFNKGFSPYRIFICAFVPFIAGAYVNNAAHNGFLAWSMTIVALLVTFFHLYRHIHRKARKAFLFFTFLSMFLSLAGSYFAANLEGVHSFREVQNFEAGDGVTSDLSAMVAVAVKFNGIAETQDIWKAIIFHWMKGYYNNRLSPIKWGFAMWSMPGIGYYSWALLAWWFCVIFYALALAMYFQAAGKEALGIDYKYACLTAWLIVPFALQYDRENIAVVLIGIIALGMSIPSRLSILDWAGMALSLLLLVLDRTAYILLPVVLAPLILWRRLGRRRAENFFQKVRTRKTVFALLCCLAASAVIMPMFRDLFLLRAAANKYLAAQVAAMEVSKQGLWSRFYIGIPVLDTALKLAFLSLTPFPFYQMFRTTEGWALIVPARLISLNVFPVFMIGKLLVLVMVARRLLKRLTSSFDLFLLALLFLIPVLASTRTGYNYLVPSMSVLVLWLLRNGFSARFFKGSFGYFLFITVSAHLLYMVVYGLQKIL